MVTSKSLKVRTAVIGADDVQNGIQVNLDAVADLNGNVIMITQSHGLFPQPGNTQEIVVLINIFYELTPAVK